jgi:hypothetical protein
MTVVSSTRFDICISRSDSHDDIKSCVRCLCFNELCSAIHKNRMCSTLDR